MKKICFDVDDVLLSSQNVLLSFLEKEYNKKLTTEDVTHWMFYHENYPKIVEYFKKQEFYTNNKPIDGMDEVLKFALDNFKEVYFVTSSHPDIIDIKNKTLKKYYGDIQGYEKIQIHHVGLKTDDNDLDHSKAALCQEGILIDDALHNIKETLSTKKTKTIIVDFNYGWNQEKIEDDINCFRAKKPIDIIDILKKIN